MQFLSFLAIVCLTLLALADAKKKKDLTEITSKVCIAVPRPPDRTCAAALGAGAQRATSSSP